MNPGRYNEVHYEEAVRLLEERHKIGVFAEECPMDKGKGEGTKAQKKAEKASEPKEKKPPTPKPPPPPGKPGQGGGKMCGDPRQARYTPPSMSKLAQFVPFSEFYQCPEGYYFCTDAKQCKPIPSGQGIGEDGMRVDRQGRKKK